MAYADANKTMLNGYYTMQDMNSNICNAVEVVDDQLQVIDTRDNKVYWIAKLRDGNCWMTQNLDLDLDSNVTYTYADTDLGRNWNDSTIDTTATWTPDNSTIKAVTDDVTIIDNIVGLTNDANAPLSVDVGSWYWSGGIYPSGNCPASAASGYIGCNYMEKTPSQYSTYFNTSPFSGSGTSNIGTHGHVGNYYSWTAAVASNDTSAYTASTYNNISQNPTTSICPANWRLPIIADYTDDEIGDNEFYNLYFLYSSEESDSALVQSPIYAVRAGSIFGNRFRLGGYLGVYWSSTLKSSTEAYFFRHASNDITPSRINKRYYVLPVRCITR